MKPIVNFNERLNGMELAVNGKLFVLSTEYGLNKEIVRIHPKNIRNRCKNHHLFQVRWNDMGFEFFRMQKHIIQIGFEKTKILSGYFTKDDCKDPIRFVNNVICRNIDKLMSDGTYYY